MRFEPGFIRELKQDLNSVKPEFRRRATREGGLKEQELLSLVSSPVDDVLDDIEHVTAVSNYDHLTQTGGWHLAIDAVRTGEVAFVVLAGDNGTRAAGSKAFMRLPKLGITLTTNKLVQSGFTTDEGEVLQAPTWFMTSPSNIERMLLHLGGLSPVPDGCVFEQFESYSLSPDNTLSFIEPGVPELYPTGHGDVGPALVESGVLADNTNVKHCVIVNVDNVMASLDLHVLGHHLETGAHVTCELVKRERGDSGGVPVWHENRAQVVESFRLPDGFVDKAVYHSTNTTIISVEALRAELQWRWHRVRKQIDGRIVVQFERMLQQYTEVFATNYVEVPRVQRYLPIKTEADLLRADEILNSNGLR
jgi:UDP-N-acetylglucosamine pyrophosphorylase